MQRLGTAAGPMVLVAIMLVMFPGCGSGDDAGSTGQSSPSRGDSFRDQTPDQFLAAVFARYRGAGAYRDQGRVVLRYGSGQQAESQVAPMQAWFFRGEVYLKVYDVRLLADSTAMTAWIEDPITDGFDSQVLKQPPLSGRPTFERLTADPILATRMAAGLGGPPPQLEWLFAAEPMKSLFGGDYRFEYAELVQIDGRMCRGIDVFSNQDRYRFWIDGPEGLIRRVELPSIIASPSAGRPAETIAVTIELAGATFRDPSELPEVDPMPGQPKYVAGFVPLPPPRPARVVGSQPSPFRIQASDGSWVLTERGSGKPATVVVRYSGDRASAVAAITVSQWHRQLSPEQAQSVHAGVLVDPSVASSTPQTITLPRLIDDAKGSAARAIQLSPGGLAIIDSPGRVAWIELGIGPETMAPVGAIVADVVAGIDVPARLTAQWREQVAQYDRAIKNAAP